MAVTASERPENPHSSGGLARGHATVSIGRLGTCVAALAGGHGQLPAATHGPPRGLGLGRTGPAGLAWLTASGDDTGIAAFTALQTAVPSAPPSWTRSSPGGVGTQFPPTAPP
jgi:hypothetical protein